MKYLIAIIISMLVIGSYAQDTTENDSTTQALKNLSAQLESYERLIIQNNQKRKQDSIARADLMRQMQMLRESDRVTQNSLRNQIREIERRDSARMIEQRKRIMDMKGEAVGYPVNPLKDTLFVIYTKLGTIKASDRAINVENKVRQLIRDDYFYPDALIAEEHDGTFDIMYQDMIIASVSDWDALWAEKEKSELAADYLVKLRTCVQESRTRSDMRNMLARIGLVFLVVGGTILVMYFIGRFITGLKGKLYKNRKNLFKGIKLGTYEFLPPTRQQSVALQSINVLKWALYALVAYFSLPIIFGLFPFTKGWADTLLGWILDPAKEILWSFWSYLPNLFTIGVIYFLTRYVTKALKFVALEVESGNLNITGFHSDWALPTYRLAKFLVYAFMFVVIYPYLPGSQTDVFKGVSVFIGLLISLGSTSAIGNAVAGLVITYMRPFRLGDRVKVGDVTGEIIEKSLLVTRIRTSKNEDITVPNSSILTGHTINYSSSSQQLGLILHTSVTIGYDVPWRKVHELLIEAAVATDGVNISREPFVLQTSLDDWYVSYQLNAYTDAPHIMPRIYSNLHENIQDKFNAAGVEIMSPHYRAVRDGNESTIPKE